METIVWKDLGICPYREVWTLQSDLFNALIEKKRAGEAHVSTILYVEHLPVYTLGKSGVAANMLISSLELAQLHAEFIPVNRGGDITFHGPGQLVVYPILDLEAYGLGVKDYIWLLEESVIRTIGEFGVKGERLSGATGVWLEGDTVRARKICAIGVKCSHFVTMHGLALNINTDLNYFHKINPCGFVDKGVTSLAKELGCTQDMEVVKRLFRKHFEALLKEHVSQ